MVLIDRSSSIPPAERALYTRSIMGIGVDIDAGGRVLVTEIGDTDWLRFTLLFELKAEDSDVASSEAFHGKGGRPFVLSDTIEGRPTLELAHLTAGPEAIPDTIAKARAAGLLFDLKGVELHIISAGGDDTALGVDDKVQSHGTSRLFLLCTDA